MSILGDRHPNCQKEDIRMGKQFYAKCPFCGTLSTIQYGKQLSGCAHYKKLELTIENKLVAIFSGEWGTEIKEVCNE